MDERMIVIVDDDLDDLELLQEELLRFDITIRTRLFSDPAKAAEALTVQRSLQPHCIFIDVNMPRMSGVEILGLLRRQPALNDSKIIILSTYLSEEDRLILHRKGANHAFTKPFTSNEYARIIYSCLANVEAGHA